LFLFEETKPDSLDNHLICAYDYEFCLGTDLNSLPISEHAIFNG